LQGRPPSKWTVRPALNDRSHRVTSETRGLDIEQRGGVPKAKFVSGRPNLVRWQGQWLRIVNNAPTQRPKFETKGESKTPNGPRGH